MARGRFLSNQISENEELGDLAECHGPWPLIVHAWMIPHLDVEGRTAGNPRVIKGRVFPMLPITAKEVAEALRQLADAGLIRWYVAECGTKVVSYPKFAEHQVGLRRNREAPSRFPAWDCDTCKAMNQPQLRSTSGATPDQLPDKGEGEGKGKGEDIRNGYNNYAEISADEKAATTNDARQNRSAGAGSEEAWRMVRTEADAMLGLQRTYADEQANATLIKQWRYKSERNPLDVIDAIRGFALLRDEGTFAEWPDPIKAGQGVTLRPLAKARALVEVGDGKVARPIWQAAVDRYRAELRKPQKRKMPNQNGKLERINVGGAL